MPCFQSQSLHKPGCAAEPVAVFQVAVPFGDVMSDQALTALFRQTLGFGPLPGLLLAGQVGVTSALAHFVARQRQAYGRYRGADRDGQQQQHQGRR
jgi:hypothetical protein